MARAPRIVYLLDDLGSGGAQRQAVETAACLAQAGRIEARFLTYHGDAFFGPRLDALGIPRRQVQKRVGLDLRFPGRLRTALRAEGPDLVHAFLRAPSFWAARALPRRGGPRFLASERNDYVGQGRREAWALRTAFRRADAVTANAAAVARAIPTRFGIAPEKVHYIPNGIDLAAWDAARAEPPALSFSQPGVHIGLVGRLVPQKNHLHFLRSLASVSAEERRTWHVWFLGAADNRQSTATAVSTAVREMSLEGQIHLVPPQARIAPLLSALDLVVLSSDYEGFPNVVLEALASGTPVVATDVGDVRALLPNECGGRVVPPGGVSALAAALRAVAGLSDAERAALGAAGRSHVEAAFGMERIAERYHCLYATLLDTDDPRD